MSIEETRQLGIEFERRIQAMAPETEFLNKLDTETIYSFLNLYQDKFIHEIYKSLDGIQSGSKISARIETILQPLYKEVEWENHGSQEDYDGTITFLISDDIGLYLRSTSLVSSMYRYKEKFETTSDNFLLTNELISQKDVNKVISDSRNSFKILKNPVIAFSSNTYSQDTVTIIFDKFTTIEAVHIYYYKMPVHFSILGQGVECELPSDVFDELVTGAVQLYVQYATSKNQNAQQELAAKSNAGNNNEN